MPLPASPLGIAIAEPAMAAPHAQAVYNPTPPVKPVAKKARPGAWAVAR